MSERTTITGNTWTQVGTGPATVQLLTDGVSLMVVCSATEPTGNDGLVLFGMGASQYFSLADAIWAQCVQGTSAVVVVQPQVAP